MYPGCPFREEIIMYHADYTKSKISQSRLIITTLLLSILLLYGCGSSSDPASVEITQTSASSRSNESVVLCPSANGSITTGNDVATVDYSNSSEGYIIVSYKGSSEKVKFQLTGPDQVTYTYNIKPSEDAVLPLSSESGDYTVSLFENIGNNQYSTAFTDVIHVDITNTYGPYLYPNQYVSFTSDSQAVAKAKELAADATCDLEVVSRVYEYVFTNITYDTEEANTVASDYLPVVDEVMETKKGICLDYAALMTAMLRSQGIPTRLEVGYAKDAYHAWISVYVDDLGWIGGVIQFDGEEWTLMDPTLAANAKSSSKIKEFIGDGSSYTTKYKY